MPKDSTTEFRESTPSQDQSGRLVDVDWLRRRDQSDGFIYGEPIRFGLSLDSFFFWRFYVIIIAEGTAEAVVVERSSVDRKWIKPHCFQ